MKREAMLKILEKKINDALWADAMGNRQENYLPGLLAKMSLDCVEEQGMKPPHHPDRYGSCWCNNTNWDTEVYEWEDE